MLRAVVEARAEVGDVAGALAVIPTVAAADQPGLELAAAHARARAGDPSLVLQIAQGPDPPAEGVLVLLAVAADLLRTPVSDSASSAFWDLDFHPFR